MVSFTESQEKGVKKDDALDKATLAIARDKNAAVKDRIDALVKLLLQPEDVAAPILQP